MKKFYWTLGTIASLCVFVVGAALLTNVAIADSSAHTCTPIQSTPCIDGLATTSARTCTIQRSSGTTAMGLASLYVDWVDGNGTVTGLGITSCEGSPDKGTNWYPIQGCAAGGGAVCTSSDATWDKTTTVNVDDEWVWRVDIEGFQSVRCTFDDTAGTAGSTDALTVNYQLCVKG